MHTSAILVFALGAAAEVPHWVQKKPLSSFKVPSVESIMAPMLSMHGRQTPNNRRLQAIMSAECKDTCPGVEAMINAMMEAAGGGTRRLDAHESGEAAMAQMKMYCEHIDALKCVAANKVCQDEGAEQDAEGQAMLECICSCPKLMDIGEDMSKVCNDKAGTVGCVKSTSTCSAMAAQMNDREINLGCEYVSKKCKEVENDFDTCMGDDDLKSWETQKCPTEVKEACCPLGKKYISCLGAECYKINLALQAIEAESTDPEKPAEEKEQAKAGLEITNKYRTTCPDAGIPSAAEVSAAGSGGSGDADSADFATPGQTVSVLAMAAVITASLMA